MPEWRSRLPIRLENVRVKRGGVEVLKRVNLSFQADRRYVLLGPSGSGKSTLLRLLNRLEDPASGAIFHGDLPLKSLPIRLVRRHVGLVFQAPRPLPGTIEENLAYPFSTRGLPRPSPEKMTEMLAELGLDLTLDREGLGLSGGERQKLALAAALAIGPEVLALDEPTSALDPASADRICEALRLRSTTTGLRTIAVCHQHGQAARLGDWGVVLKAGRVALEGPIGEIPSRVADLDRTPEPLE